MADKRRMDNAMLENVRIVFRNFKGEGGPYNREGDRNFSVVLDAETAERMKDDGWKVKTKPPREPGEDEFHTLPVAVSFKGRPPQITMISSRGRTRLDEESVETLDYVMIDNVDLILSPYQWEVNGNTGVKAYLEKIFVTIHEDALDLKYAEIKDAEEADLLREDGRDDELDERRVRFE
jgi:hypothetical protein